MSNYKAPELTWQELKDFCNSIDEKFLDRKVGILGEERGFSVNFVEGLSEDYFITDEGIEPKSAFTEDDDTEDYGTYEKGHPFLHIDA